MLCVCVCGGCSTQRRLKVQPPSDPGPRVFPTTVAVQEACDMPYAAARKRRRGDDSVVESFSNVFLDAEEMGGLEEHRQALQGARMSLFRKSLPVDREDKWKTWESTFLSLRLAIGDARARCTVEGRYRPAVTLQDICTAVNMLADTREIPHNAAVMRRMLANLACSR